MSVVTARAAPLGTLLRLGRVSNLPTVWTNVIAATALAGGDPLSWRAGVALLAMTLFYVGGMYLNDAFDREIDARERPKRPIPSGEVSAGLVFGAGFAMLAAGVALMALHGLLPGLAGLALAAAIVF
ncbi:MAG TPA: UbiA family prenyltransferase, partial [Beijerinckiaceae bacterium]|nr:UbiA family prenyltransferase [Beijerinckiaceae bacterium]